MPRNLAKELRDLKARLQLNIEAEQSDLDLLEHVALLFERKQTSVQPLFKNEPGPIDDHDLATITRALMPLMLDEHHAEFDARSLLVSKLISRIIEEKNRYERLINSLASQGNNRRNDANSPG